MMESLQVYTDSDSHSDTDVKKEKGVPEPRSSFFGIDFCAATPSIIDNNVHYEDDHKSDVPDSDFWKGFVPDSPSAAPCHNLGKDNGNSIKTSQFINFGKRHCPSNSSNVSGKHVRLSYQDNECQIANNAPHRRPYFTQQEPRKLFYIHSKIAPYLTTKSSCCKCASKSSSSWRSHGQAINRIMWNRPNFSHLLLTAGMDSLVKVWNVWSSVDRCVATINHHTKAIRNALWGNQGKSIISCSYDKTAIVTEVESGTIKSRYTHPGFVTACCLHPVDPNCFVTGTENLIQFWDQRTPMSPVKVLTYKDKMGQPQDLLFINGGKELISCSDIVSRDSADRTIMAWDVKSGNVISNQIYQERYTCTRLKQGPHHSHFLAQTQGGYVALFSTTRPYKLDKNKRFEGHELQGYNIGFDISHDGNLVYSGSANGGIHCYDYRSGRLIKKCVEDINDVITDVACHPVLSTLIASCSWGGSITLWQ